VFLRVQPGSVDTNDFVVWDPQFDGASLYGWHGGNLGSTSGGGKPVLTWRESGLVGIGTQNPAKAKLEVEGNAVAALPGYGFLNSTAPTGTAPSQSVYLSIYCSDRVAAIEVDAFSDARIKKIKGRSDGREDLRSLLDLEITDYTFVDFVTKGNRPNKKVIAQQVERVYPQAVSTMTEVVPDIYRKVEARAGWILLATNLQPALKVGDRVKLITERQTALHEVVDVSTEGFRIKEMLDGPVFVYGREVNDFRMVDYEAIAMLNVSATQELHRRLQASEAQVTALKQRNDTLESRLAEIERRLQGLLAEPQQTAQR